MLKAIHDQEIQLFENSSLEDDWAMLKSHLGIHYIHKRAPKICITQKRGIDCVKVSRKVKGKWIELCCPNLVSAATWFISKQHGSLSGNRAKSEDPLQRHLADLAI